MKINNIGLRWQFLIPVLIMLGMMFCATLYVRNKINLADRNVVATNASIRMLAFYNTILDEVNRINALAQGVDTADQFNNLSAESNKAERYISEIHEQAKKNMHYSKPASKDFYIDIEKKFKSYRVSMENMGKTYLGTVKNNAALPKLYPLWSAFIAKHGERYNDFAGMPYAQYRRDISRTLFSLSDTLIRLDGQKDDVQIKALQESSVNDLLFLENTLSAWNDDLVKAELIPVVAAYKSQLMEQFQLSMQLAALHNKGKQDVQTMIAMANEVVALRTTAVQTQADDTQTMLSAINYALLLAIGTAALLSVIIALLMAAQAVNPVIRLQHIASKIAEGDLTLQSGIEGHNEIASLAVNNDYTVRQLRSTVNELKLVGTEVASAATELSAIMQQSEQNANQEQSQVEQIASAVTQLSASATEVDASATQAQHNATAALKLSEQGTKVAQESAVLCSDLTLQLGSTADAVNSLNAQSERIGDVINVINSISEQTNLLALNAAIEAARAGEMGRGFAVVADEVRVLAGRTQESTRTIQTIIGSLQAQSAHVVANVAQSLTLVEQTAAKSAQTRDQLAAIADAVTIINQNNAEMATAANEQSRAINEVSMNVNTISDIINQNVTGVGEARQAGRHLSELSERQSEQLSQFKV